MAKITFMGAGSTVFARNILGDCMLAEPLFDAEIALYDIDAVRLRESKAMLDVLNKNINKGRAKITAHLGVGQRKKALRGAGYVINAIQVGGYDPCTITDFEIPKKFGLRQTIADTLGIGGIFRALRTLPVMLDFARDIGDVCPAAWFLNYTNPMAMLTGGLLRGSGVKAVGLCHSVQCVGQTILGITGLDKKYPVGECRQLVAGINHMGWLLKIEHKGRDLYPEIRREAAKILKRHRGGEPHWDLVRLELMARFGCYVTESSEHNAEYHPYFIKKSHPGLVDEYHIPLDEYPRRCVSQIEGWKKMGRDIVGNPNLTHARTGEYGSHIIEAIESGVPTQIGGNVLNNGLIPNLPPRACVEIPCLVDRNGVQGVFVGDLPEPLAALNRTNINPQLLAIEAVLEGRKDRVYQAAMLDPHTAAELPIDDIVKLCDALIEAHGGWLPKFA